MIRQMTYWISLIGNHFSDIRIVYVTSNKWLRHICEQILNTGALYVTDFPIIYLYIEMRCDSEHQDV